MNEIERMVIKAIKTNAQYFLNQLTPLQQTKLAEAQEKVDKAFIEHKMAQMDMKADFQRILSNG